MVVEPLVYSGDLLVFRRGRRREKKRVVSGQFGDDPISATESLAKMPPCFRFGTSFEPGLSSTIRVGVQPLGVDDLPVELETVLVPHGVQGQIDLEP